MVKIITTTSIKDFTGKPLQINKKSITLREVLLTSLNYINSNPQLGAKRELSSTDKFKAYGLGIRIAENKEISLTSEEVVFIKEAVGAIYSPLIFGRVSEILENKKE